MDNKIADCEAIELAEAEVDRLISVCHQQGLSYWEILKIFLVRCPRLQMMADAEYHQKGGL